MGYDPIVFLLCYPRRSRNLSVSEIKRSHKGRGRVSKYGVVDTPLCFKNCAVMEDWCTGTLTCSKIISNKPTTEKSRQRQRYRLCHFCRVSICLNLFSKTISLYAWPRQVQTKVHFKILQFLVVTYAMGVNVIIQTLSRR